MKKALFLVIGILCFSLQLFSEPVTREKILEMVEARVDTELIIALIERDCVDFDVDADLLIAWSGKVDKNIIKAINACRKIYTIPKKPALEKPSPVISPAPPKIKTLERPSVIETPDTPEDIQAPPFSETLPLTIYLMEFKSSWISEKANVLEATFYKDRIVCLPCRYTYGTWSGELKSKTEFDPYTVDYSSVQECLQENREIVLKTNNGDVHLDMKSRKGLNDDAAIDLCDRWLARVGRRPSRGDFPSIDYAEEQLAFELNQLIMDHQTKSNLQHP